MPVLLIAVAVLSASCGGPAVDKLGAPIPQPVVRLKVGVSDPGDAAFTYFVEAAQRASEGRIQLDVDRTTYYSQTPGGEANLAGALRSAPLTWRTSRPGTGRKPATSGSGPSSHHS